MINESFVNENDMDSWLFLYLAIGYLINNIPLLSFFLCSMYMIYQQVMIAIAVYFLYFTSMKAIICTAWTLDAEVLWFISNVINIFYAINIVIVINFINIFSVINLITVNNIANIIITRHKAKLACVAQLGVAIIWFYIIMIMINSCICYL